MGNARFLRQPRRGRAGRGQIDQPEASARAAFHEVALPIARRPAFGAVGDDEPIRVDEKRRGRGAKRLSADLGDRLARVRPFEDQHAAPVEPDGEAVRSGPAATKLISLLEGAAVARTESFACGVEPQDLRAARTEQRAVGAA